MTGDDWMISDNDWILGDERVELQKSSCLSITTPISRHVAHTGYSPGSGWGRGCCAMRCGPQSWHRGPSASRCMCWPSPAVAPPSCTSPRFLRRISPRQLRHRQVHCHTSAQLMDVRSLSQIRVPGPSPADALMLVNNWSTAPMKRLKSFGHKERISQ